MTDGDLELERLREQGRTLLTANRLEDAKALFARISQAEPNDADAWLALSNINGTLGNIDEAGECCRRVLALQPTNSEARLNLGNVLLSKGSYEAALEQYRKVLDSNPGHAVAHSNLGNALAAMGRHDEAGASYQAAIELDPNSFIAFFNLGMLRMRQGEYAKAVNNFRRSLDLAANGAQLNAIKDQGGRLLDLDRFEEAKALFADICRVDPEDADAWYRFGIVNGRLGAADAAADCCRRVIVLRPNHVGAHVSLGHVLFQYGKFAEAVAQYERALEIDPGNIPALNNMAKACQTEDQFKRYLQRYRSAVAVMPDPAEARTVFIGVMKNRVLPEYSPWLDDELQKFFTSDGVDYRMATALAARLLKLKYHVRPLPDDDDAAAWAVGKKIGTDRLFAMFLEKTVNVDEDLEYLLTKIRRKLLLVFCDDMSSDRAKVETMAVLALQCFNNEYVFVVTEDEERKVQTLSRDVSQRLSEGGCADGILEGGLAALGMYERLWDLPCRGYLDSIRPEQWSPGFRRLFETAFINPRDEEEIKRGLPQIAGIEDRTSRLVQSQYEENPYPTWVSIDVNRRRSLDLVLRQRYPHFASPAFLRGPIQILVAGCGTGKHPIRVALSYRKAEVLAVDISSASLAYATRMARKYKVENIQFMQGDILQLAKLNRCFHVIESVGVLHHMADPLKGWKTLTGLLARDGLMFIGLYSEQARSQVVAAREIIRQENIMPDKASIRNFRARILRRELSDGMYEMAHHSPDFYSTSGCRDLLFHYEEHRFTLPQLKAILDELRLQFIGFALVDDKAEGLYREHFPEDPNMTDLLLWDKFETMYPHTFGEMYQFWCQASDTVQNGKEAQVL